MLLGVLPHFAQALKSQPMNASVANLYVHSLLRHPEAFTDNTHCKLVLDDFLMTWVQYEEILHHILRLLWCTYEKIDSQLLVTILTVAQPALQVFIRYPVSNSNFSCRVIGNGNDFFYIKKLFPSERRVG